MKNITRKQFILYGKIIDAFMESIPDKEDFYYAEDLDFFSRIEVACLDFETSFIIRDENDDWKIGEDGIFKMKEYNEDGEPWLTTEGTFENRFDIMEVTGEIFGNN